MKKILHVALIALFTFSMASAQKQIVWFDVGLKAQIGATGLLNKSLVDSKDINYTIGLTSGLGLGGRIGINKNYSGLSIEGMYFKGKQELKAPFAKSLSYDWKSVDLYALFRNSKNLGYFEIGPKVQFLSKMNGNLDGNSTDITADFNKTNFAGVLGFGANIMGNDGAFSGILGLRFEYGFTDIVSKDGQVSNPVGDPGAAYASTNPWFAGMVFEFNWGIGYFGKAQCGARSKFIMF